LSKMNNIEKSVNRFLETSGRLIMSKFKAMTPNKVKNSAEKTKNAINSKTDTIKEGLKSKKDLGMKRIGEAKEGLNKAKEKTSIAVGKAKETKVREINWSKLGLSLAALLAPTFIKFKKWYIGLKPEAIASFVGISTVASLASLNIYVESNNIADKSREPASELVEEVERGTAVSRRPAYFKRVEKQFKVSNVVLPFYVSSGDPLKKLVIDFTFESSNKYIKEYLWQNPHLIHDTLNSQVEPLSVTFPLENEGKVIVKEKIRKEINVMLKSHKIKGEITQIYIHSIIGG